MKRMTFKEFWDNILSVYDNGFEMKDGNFYTCKDVIVEISSKDETSIEDLNKEKKGGEN